MAITKIIGSIHKTDKSTYRALKNTINYICNPEKTENGKYVGTQLCDVNNVLSDFIETYKIFGKEPKKKSDRLAYHMCISWKPDEENISLDKAYNVLGDFCKKYIPEHEAVYSVHKDQEHIHGHICFNAVNCQDGLKYRYNKNDWEKSIQPIVDEICEKYNLSRLEDDTGLTLEQYDDLRNKRFKKKTKSSNNKYYNEKNERYTLSDYLRDDIDYFINISESYDEFINNLKNAGYQVKIGKSKKYGTYTAIKYEGMERFKRTYSLGKNYTDNMIKNRIDLNKKNNSLDKEEIRYFVPKKFYRVRIHYDFSNPIIRNRYYRIHKAGVGSVNSRRPNYNQIKKAIENIDKLQYQLEILEKGCDINTIKKSLHVVKSNINSIEKEILQKKQSIRNVNQMIKTYNKYEELIKINEKESCLDEIKRIERIIDSYSYGVEELYAIKNEYKKDLSSIKKEYKKEQEKEAALKELIDEFDNPQNLEKEDKDINLEDIDNSFDESKQKKKDK
ncbi:MAG: hypothetical protein E7279_01435 [Lachnospiraceae bacterium]|nr:hypothetical protein [Lachnospiraceae bacterium]